MSIEKSNRTKMQPLIDEIAELRREKADMQDTIDKQQRAINAMITQNENK